MPKKLTLSPELKQLAAQIRASLDATIASEAALAEAEKQKSDLMAKHEPIMSFEGGRIHCSVPKIAELISVTIPKLGEDHAKAVKDLSFVMARAKTLANEIFDPLIADALADGKAMALPFYPDAEHLAHSAAREGSEVKLLNLAKSACLNDGDLHEMNRARMVLAGLEQFTEKT